MPDDPQAFYASIFDRKAWNRATWHQVALCVEETGENPPLLGLIFGDQDSARALFKDLVRRVGGSDDHKELRVALIEGDVPSQKPGFSVHIGADPAGVAARMKADSATVAAPTLDTRGAWVRGSTREGSTLLQDFKAQYEKHGSAMLSAFLGAPGRLAPTLDCCISTSIQFRKAADVKDDASDLDAALLAKPRK